MAKRRVGERGRGKNPTPTLREIAVLLGISYERVRQLEKTALEKLRRHPVIRQLAEDHDIIPRE